MPKGDAPTSQCHAIAGDHGQIEVPMALRACNIDARKQTRAYPGRHMHAGDGVSTLSYLCAVFTPPRERRGEREKRTPGRDFLQLFTLLLPFAQL